MIFHQQHKSICLDNILASDSDKIKSWRNSEAIRKWSRQSDLLNDETHDKWMSANGSTYRMYGIYQVLDTHNELIGVCGLSNIDTFNQRAEFSIYIAPEHQGKGFSKIALETLFDHAFKTYPLNSIYGETFEGNLALNLFKKVGMRVDGTRRKFYYKDGKFVDSILISITREEFNATTNNASDVTFIRSKLNYTAPYDLPETGFIPERYTNP